MSKRVISAVVEVQGKQQRLRDFEILRTKRRGQPPGVLLVKIRHRGEVFWARIRSDELP
jgi:hypothetical protein